MEKSLSPILLFTYRRVPKKTIESLLQNELASKSELFIYSDGYKNDVDRNDVLKAREYLKTIDGFKSTRIMEASKNKGLANSIINGVTEIINKYGKVIVLEDDLIVANNFLEYMNNALDYYKEESNIWSISGYSPKLPCLENYNKDVYLTMRASSWGWATWKDRWDSIDWEIKDWNEFKRNKIEINKFNKSGNDMFKMLELQMLGKIDSWAIRWCYNQFRQKKYTIYPTVSKLINKGFDNKGTHNSRGYQRWNVEISNKDVIFENIEPNEEILKCFKKYYDLKVITRCGYFLRKIGGYKLAKKLLDKVSR